MNRLPHLCLLLLLVTLPVAAGATQWLDAKDFQVSGSSFSTGAVATAGSNQVTVKDPGDFAVGQGVMVSRCSIRYESKMLWGPRKTYEARRALKDELEVRGYDGSAGSWFVYIVDVAPGAPSRFRYSVDLGRNWKDGGPVDDQWHALGGGTEIRFVPGKLDWTEGYTVSFSARDQLVSRIEKIEGKVLTLRDAANRSADDAVMRHCDGEALQAAVDAALARKRDLYLGPGYYRLAKGVVVRNPNGLTIQGANPQDVVFDLSEGTGTCLSLSGGTEATLRNLTMVGNCGFADSDIAGYLSSAGGRGIWGFYLKPCNAVTTSGTERVLVENCHGRRMSQECFLAGGASRAAKPPRTYSQAITYLRCSVIDCGRNAFNDWNVGPENTAILQCRIVDVGGCSWEGASRFVRFVGNYVRNAGTVAMGNIGPPNRDESFGPLGAGQHIIADNVFESGNRYGGKLGGSMIAASFGATQVVIRDNLFVNFNSTAITASGRCDATHFPSGKITICGNLIDLTAVNDPPVNRCGIDVSASGTIVSNNQVYVRGASDPLVTALRVREPALHVSLHDNLVRHCGVGLSAQRARARVGEVIDVQTFLLPAWCEVPVARRESDLYQGWPLVWLKGAQILGSSVLEGCDPDTCRFRLREGRELKVGDEFELYPPYGANWDLHDNTISDCLQPVVLDAYGSEASAFRDNLVCRGRQPGVKEAMAVRGRFQVTGNSFVGFDEPGAVALGLYRDRRGGDPGSLYRGNRFVNCTQEVTQEQQGLWRQQ